MRSACWLATTLLLVTTQDVHIEILQDTQEVEQHSQHTRHAAAA